MCFKYFFQILGVANLASLIDYVFVLELIT